MAEWKSEYDASEIAAPTGMDTSQYGSSSSKSKGTYSYEISLQLIFWKEIQLLMNTINPPSFDGGIITEISGGGKCKVKLQGTGEVVNVKGTQSIHKKGWYALILCTPNSNQQNTSYSYSLVAAKQVFIETSTPSEYSV